MPRPSRLPLIPVPPRRPLARRPRPATRLAAALGQAAGLLQVPGLPALPFPAAAQDSGCAAGRPDSRPEQAALPISRAQAAVLLQACPAGPAAAEDEPLERLWRQSAPELERLQGQLRSQAVRLTALEATPFSTTSSLRVDVRWWLGAVGYSGNQVDRAANSYDGRPLRDALSFNYDVRFAFTTSFDGEDLLRVRLRSGNGGFSGFRDSIAPTLRLNGLSPGCTLPETCRNNQLRLDKLFYQRSLGPQLRATVGSRVNQKDMIAIWPSAFDDNENLVALFGKGGAPGAYSDVKGAGIGLYWTQRADADGGVGWVVSAVSVAGDGNDGDPAEGGLFTAGSAGASSLQLGFQGEGWAAAAVYTFNQAGALDKPGMTPLATQTWPEPAPGFGGHVHSFGLTGFWQPQSSGWLPAISLGWGYNRNVFGPGAEGSAGPWPPQAAESQSWMVGLNWYDLLLADSELGVAIGSPVFLTRYRNADGQEGAADHAIQMELWYRIQATDWLTITPGLLWLPRPRGQLSAAGTAWDSTPLPLGRGASFSALGAVLKLRFRF